MNSEITENKRTNIRSTWKNSLFLKIAIPIVLFSIIGIGGLWYYVPQILQRNIIEDATITAEQSVTQFKLLRGYYTQNVIKKVIGKSDIKASFDHKGVDKTIPLPATVIHDMSELLEKEGISIKLYSGFPFPNRKERQLDSFGQEAWDYLVQNPNAIYVKNAEIDGRNSVRVAVADKMVDQSCVNCHNTRPDTPFSDWKLGDVRGVLEITTDIEQQLANGVATSNIVNLVFLLTLLFILAVLWLALKKKVFKPLKQATHAANEIAVGNLQVDIDSKKSGEIGDLMKELAKMRDNLSQSFKTERLAAAENNRIKQALDNVKANVMIADSEHNIIYINPSLTGFLKQSETNIRQSISSFNPDDLINSNLGVFYEGQDKFLSSLNTTHENDIQYDHSHIRIYTTPIIDQDGKRQGTVVEWVDRYQQAVVQEEMHSIMQSALSGDLSQRIKLDDKEDYFLVMSEGINDLLEVCNNVISDVGHVLEAMAQGDLSKRANNEYGGAFAKLSEDITLTNNKLTEVVDGLSSSAHLVLNGSQEIAQGNTNLSQRTEQQASNLEETASSMEQMTSTVRQNADNARQADQLATGARSQAEDGGAVVSKAVSAMSEITDSSNKIAAIIGVIDEIAFQTNLLALNAAVEAARAGEQGRGFAVVASEVRNLAGRSATAAKEIKDLIEDSVTKVEEGSKLVDASGQTLEEIVTSVKKVSDIIAEIAAASIEQSDGIEQVNKAISQMDEMTQQNAALVEEAAAASESMGEQAHNLNELIDFFMTNGTKTSSPAIERRTISRPWTNKPEALASSTTAIPKNISNTGNSDWEVF